MKLDLTGLRNIQKECKQTSETAKADFQSLNQTLEDICSNVQSGELSAANKKLVASITNLSQKLSADLLKVENFLNEQLNAYENTNEEAKNSLDQVANLISENLA